jgi:hypothetical protein
MGVRSTIGWVTRGRANTTATLDALSADLVALQTRVDELTASVQRIDRSVSREIDDVRQQQLVEFDKVREAVIATTDDLAERIAALHRGQA